MICPDCGGAKTVRALVKYSSRRPCAVETLHCFRCKGSGAVPDEVAQWIADGRRLYAARDERDFSVLQMARELGVPVVDLSDAEHGRRDPRPYLALIAERRLRAETLRDLDGDD